MRRGRKGGADGMKWREGRYGGRNPLEERGKRRYIKREREREREREEWKEREERKREREEEEGRRGEREGREEGDDSTPPRERGLVKEEKKKPTQETDDGWIMSSTRSMARQLGSLYHTRASKHLAERRREEEEAKRER